LPLCSASSTRHGRHPRPWAEVRRRASSRSRRPRSIDPGFPRRTYSAGKATNLNADKLDGLEASDLAEPRGYAHVTPEGDIDTSYPRKGVNDIIIPTGETSLYCFDLTFTPKTAVGSPHPFNSAVVGTATPDLDSNPGNDVVSQECPTNYKDAVVKTYGSSTGTDAATNFQIVFE